jgi:aspartate-semialdehyde dehydrogenase
MTESVRRFDVAVVGATGVVGEALLTVLEERGFPIGKLHVLASEGSADETLVFGNRPFLVRPVDGFDFGRCQLAFFCVPAAVAAAHVARAVAAGCRVIDLSAHSRFSAPLLAMDAGAGHFAADAPLYASPSAQALQLATVLAPLQRVAGLRQVAVTTLLAVSARGRAGINELAGQTARLLNVQAVEHKVFPAQIAFNTIPSFDAPGESGYTHEELQLGAEVRQLLGDEALVVAASQSYVPVFYGHTQIVQLEMREPLGVAAAQSALSAAPGIRWLEEGESLTPVDGLGGGEAVVVGRLCQLPGERHRLTLWSIADNVRKGAAVNSTLIAENLIKNLP